jgi:hypothetical protein
MTYGVRTWDGSTGELTFDSPSELVLFAIEERVVTGSSVGRGAGITFSYPAYTGKKINAFMQSPYDTGDLDGWCVLSCRISYPSGVPTVTVFVDNSTSSLPICSGYLVVTYTGAAQ